MLLQKCLPFSTGLLITKKKKEDDMSKTITPLPPGYYSQKDQYNYKDDFKIAEGEWRNQEENANILQAIPKDG